MKYMVGITGASGSILGIRLIEELLAAGKDVSAVVSTGGWRVIGHEVGRGEPIASVSDCIGRRRPALDRGRLTEYAPDDFFSPLASGSSGPVSAIICPCSMKTLAAIAHGYADSLITRSADIALKERRPCIVVPRETPLGLIPIENMLKIKQAGADIVLPVPGFYAFPQTIDDVVDFIIGRVLDLAGIDHSLSARWGAHG